MEKIIKCPKRQDCHYKLTPGTSNETSINIPIEVYNYIRPTDVPIDKDVDISFNIYKDDYIKALCFIVNRLPLYKTGSARSTEVTYSTDLFTSYYKSILNFFGENASAIYHVKLLNRGDGRIYLKELNDNGFNLRRYLVESNSVLFFLKENNNLTLRLETGENTFKQYSIHNTENEVNKIIIAEKDLKTYIFETVKYLSEVDGLDSIIPYIASDIKPEVQIKISSSDNEDPNLQFSLTGMFIETTEEGLTERNINQETGKPKPRWFTEKFALDGHTVYLSSEWYGKEKDPLGKRSYNLTLKDFNNMLVVCYPGMLRYSYEHNKHTLRGRQKTNHTQYEQTIYYGSPGTGKSHTVEKFIKEVKEKNPSITDYRTTFHPDSDYASFVGSYKPVVKQDSLHKGKKYTEDELAAIYVKNVVPAENSSIGFVEQRIKFGVDYCEYFNGDIAEYDINHILELAGKEVEAGSKNRVGFTYVQYGVKIGPDTRRLVNESTITYEFVPQVFTKAYVDAWNKLEEGTPVYLVIEEINRGNCAQIFGDIFQLLDRKDDGSSKYPVVPDTDLKDYLTGLENWGKTHPGIANGLCLPPNLNIIATMNTSDQSLFPMDSAFKRRWDWKFIPIDPDCPESQFKITIGEKHFSWASFITKVNQRILKLTESEDKQIGNFFIKKDIDAEEFKSKVMFYLWNDVCKEHYNAGSFFKYTSGEDVENEFTFNQLFAGDVTNILQGFMAYLEVEEK